ncbi:MAG TPA: outer membrane protein assembly factor BamD, partial [Allosphingosinicella sp.]
AGKEMEVGRFYQRRGQWLAASTRFRTVIDEYQQTSHVPEALMRLTESYLALGIPEEARRSAAVLGANFSETRWYQRAFELVQNYQPRPARATPQQQPSATPAAAEQPPAQQPAEEPAQQPETPPPPQR